VTNAVFDASLPGSVHPWDLARSIREARAAGKGTPARPVDGGDMIAQQT
jgi:hypothetical protein